MPPPRPYEYGSSEPPAACTPRRWQSERENDEKRKVL